MGLEVMVYYLRCFLYEKPLRTVQGFQCALPYSLTCENIILKRPVVVNSYMTTADFQEIGVV